ncbi:MAG: hypothetical protein HY282_14880 [Nitrospirae bacterium]|nr:hypothetical protein [Candidatus Manganitrophaceae bacterium]
MRFRVATLGGLLAGLLGLLWASASGGAGIQTEILTISGEVIYVGNPPGPIVIEVYDRPQFSPRPVFSTAVMQSGAYALHVRPGIYYLRAFVDLNGNHLWDAGEPVGFYAAEQRLVVVPLASKSGINIQIPLVKESADLKRGNH